MNREIKFRGKIKEKGMKPVFFEGSLIHVTSTYKGEEDEQECNVYQIVNEDGVAFFVEEETIGQYTGLSDKNGKEIYEGDIVKALISGRWFVGKVIYEHSEFTIDVMNNKELEFGRRGIIEHWTEVIGNIYDNPELLGGE